MLNGDQQKTMEEEDVRTGTCEGFLSKDFVSSFIPFLSSLSVESSLPRDDRVRVPTDESRSGLYNDKITKMLETEKTKPYRITL